MALTGLYCGGNTNLSTLDVSNNVALTDLNCDNTNLSTLDISNNIALTFLSCSYTNLSTLDVSANTFLSILVSGSNPNLSSINLKNGNTANLQISSPYTSDFENLPNLQTVCVDDLNTSVTSFITTEVGHSVTFTVDCTALSTEENNLLSFNIYPTPTSNLLNIKSKTEITKIAIFNELGQLVLGNTNQNTIDISNLNTGFYFTKVEDVNGNFGIEKVVKK